MSFPQYGGASSPGSGSQSSRNAQSNSQSRKSAAAAASKFIKTQEIVSENIEKFQEIKEFENTCEIKNVFFNETFDKPSFRKKNRGVFKRLKHWVVKKISRTPKNFDCKLPIFYISLKVS